MRFPLTQVSNPRPSGGGGAEQGLSALPPSSRERGEGIPASKAASMHRTGARRSNNGDSGPLRDLPRWGALHPGGKTPGRSAAPPRWSLDGSRRPPESDLRSPGREPKRGSYHNYLTRCFGAEDSLPRGRIWRSPTASSSVPGAAGPRIAATAHPSIY